MEVDFASLITSLEDVLEISEELEEMEELEEEEVEGPLDEEIEDGSY